MTDGYYGPLNALGWAKCRLAQRSGMENCHLILISKLVSKERNEPSDGHSLYTRSVGPQRSGGQTKN